MQGFRKGSHVLLRTMDFLHDHHLCWDGVVFFDIQTPPLNSPRLVKSLASVKVTKPLKDLDLKNHQEQII